jgi:putative membrane protein
VPIPKPRNILPFRHNRPLQVMVLWLLVLWIITAIEPFNRRDWLLENLLVFVYSGLLVFSYPRFAFSNLSYALFTVFLSLHLIGAHYTYEHAPPGDWLQALFDVQRNHYDRIVHFCFGLLIAHPFRELLLRAAGVRPAWSPFLAVNCILAFSAFYELLEAAVATLVSPELGAAYLGTQGDSWDAQKDAFLAFSGALLAMALSWSWTRSRSNR